MKFVVWLHSIVFEVTISQYIFQWSVYLTTVSDKYVRLWKRAFCSLSILFLVFCPSFPPISFYLYGNIEWFTLFLAFDRSSVPYTLICIKRPQLETGTHLTCYINSIWKNTWYDANMKQLLKKLVVHVLKFLIWEMMMRCTRVKD